MANTTNRNTYSANSHYLRVVVFALLGCIAGALIVYGFLNVSNVPSLSRPLLLTPVTDIPLNVAEPARLRIPSVGIETTFEGPLGLNADQSVEVPDSYDRVGWYKHAPLPGTLGPAVVLGHVDSFEGPAVFHPLTKTKEGDVIEIERVDGTVATFAITKLLYRPQSSFPTEEVYGNIDHAGLRLITCSGSFDRGKQVYSHNLIVFAKLVEEPAS